MYIQICANVMTPIKLPGIVKRVVWRRDGLGRSMVGIQVYRGVTLG